MLLLVCAYVAVIGFVQGARYIKRFYVRRFANDINRGMKQVLYGNLVHKSVGELEKEGAGSLLTKAVSDVDACVEGIRKFTTEILIPVLRCLPMLRCCCGTTGGLHCCVCCSRRFPI